MSRGWSTAICSSPPVSADTTPRGSASGSVEEVRTDDNGLTKYAVIAPLVDMNQLTEVFVITDFDIVD